MLQAGTQSGSPLQERFKSVTEWPTTFQTRLALAIEGIFTDDINTP